LSFDESHPRNDPQATSHEPPLLSARLVALFEVVLCSDYPTQLALSATLNLLGFAPFDANGRLSLFYVVTLSVADTILLITLVVLFLHAHGERVHDVLLGSRPPATEIRVGIQLIFAALAIGIAVLMAIQAVSPNLHNRARNPLQDLIREPRSAGIFALVVVLAGGVREEIQRAFVLHRFSVWLGGGTVGLIVGSIAFGAGHVLQGYDAAIATGLLGVFWGIVYLRRRSVIAPMISHSGFNLLELLQALVFAS
jgi:membrane protease YdiL (CAAX protease family)